MTEDFKKLINADRESRQKSSWSGTVLEYLEVLRVVTVIIVPVAAVTGMRIVIRHDRALN